jgi:pimeloyl-ACP methyl ester carboxylesterase
MSAVPPTKVRSQVAQPDQQGRPTFEWTLSHTDIRDVVQLVAKADVLPVIFVPGIMGSNLRDKKTHKQLWRLDAGLGGAPTKLAKSMLFATAGDRQKLLHPALAEVDPDGHVPKRVERIGDADLLRKRGWGEVAEPSYHEFLIWLDEQLNPVEWNPARWHEYHQMDATVGPMPKPGDQPKLMPGLRMGLQGQPFGAELPFAPVMSDELLKRSKLWMPVHAVGYNWLDSNQVAATHTLKPAIERIIASYNKGHYSCEQVILVTHSMGGLVARACAQLPGMADKIAGVVHGVMPAVGAAVAYRRCKVGMADESAVAGMVIGSSGKEVTAVFAQAPGALQLLPSHQYQPGWLRIMQGSQAVETWPKGNPYDDIYRCRDKWWGLITEEWLSPKDGKPLRWDQYLKNIEWAQDFHQDLANKYHPNTYVYYGADKKQKSFEKVTWRMQRGISPGGTSPSPAQVTNLPYTKVRVDGRSPEYVGGQTEVMVDPVMGAAHTYETSHWELHCEMQDGAGDGTVPTSSGASPKVLGGASIRQQFKLTGFAHEGSYKESMTTRRATLYAITRIVGQAKMPG